MKGNMNALMKQVQQMQNRIAKIQEKLANETVEGQAGGGMITAVVNGKHELLSIKIEPEAVDPEDVEMLQDLVVAAINTAMKNMQNRINDEMAKATGGMKIPGLM